MTPEAEKTAVLYAPKAPTPEQEKRFAAFLQEQYGEEIPLVWEESDEPGGGFRLQVGSHIYDWTAKGLAKQLGDRLQELAAGEGDIVPLIRDTVRNWVPRALAQEIGTVLSVGDGVATVGGLSQAVYGEVLLFEGGVRGMVQSLTEEEAGCVLFDSGDTVVEGSRVYRTGKAAGMPVGDGFLGRVVDALGNPIDGLGDIVADGYRPMEHPAPGIPDRQPVNEPLQTGMLTIDAMFPIGKGQRELIIGDRQTGKTAIAVDAILNQKGQNVICIYVAIGQKASSVAQLCHVLRERGAMAYTAVIHAGAADAAPLQYLAPYVGCALGEYFMEKGRDVLIVYDDLSKHAVAYRSLSLLLGRAPGREAYPGDVFYLHSRLLERSAHLSEERGGGSMTALPIVETQAGDVSAYIPTNIISITDGQIFLETDLFFSGQRPAVNVGLSVSRVGGDAQTKAMKTAAGALRLDLAQYREMQVFTQFASDLDEVTTKQLFYGKGLMHALRQNQHQPLRHDQQVILLVVMLGHLLEKIPIQDIRGTKPRLLAHFEQTQAALCRRLNQTGVLSAEDRACILREAEAFLSGSQEA